ncbi:MAG: hypothetical protein ABIJ61_06015 [bacterium]
MPFCPNCDAEYKGKLSVCPECGEHLNDQDEVELVEVQDEEYEGMLCLFRSPTQEESEEATDALRDAGIKYVFKPLGRIHPSEAFDGEFYVNEDDFEEATRILEDIVGDVEEL